MTALPKCDCLNTCGDDPWLPKGKAEHCEHFKDVCKKKALREEIAWKLVTDELPDADETVLGFMGDSDPEIPVWLCYLDDNQWRHLDGIPLDDAPVAWATLPNGPSDTPWMKVRGNT